MDYVNTDTSQNSIKFKMYTIDIFVILEMQNYKSIPIFFSGILSNILGDFNDIKNKHRFIKMSNIKK